MYSDSGMKLENPHRVAQIRTQWPKRVRRTNSVNHRLKNMDPPSPTVDLNKKTFPALNTIYLTQQMVYITSSGVLLTEALSPHYTTLG